jgi:hypothetical protein
MLSLVPDRFVFVIGKTQARKCFDQDDQGAEYSVQS